jgi:hypothetical protein
MPVIPVNKVVDEHRIIGKRGLGVADPLIVQHFVFTIHLPYNPMNTNIIFKPHH